MYNATQTLLKTCHNRLKTSLQLYQPQKFSICGILFSLPQIFKLECNGCMRHMQAHHIPKQLYSSHVLLLPFVPVPFRTLLYLQMLVILETPIFILPTCTFNLQKFNVQKLSHHEISTSYILYVFGKVEFARPLALYGSLHPLHP